MVGTNRDIDAAKDRLVESLSSARDVTVAAAREDIAPAVAAAVEATIDAAAPIYNEAASLATDAVNSLRDSGAVNSVLNSDTVQSLITTKARRRRRWPFVLAGLGTGTAVFVIIKRRTSPDELIDLTESSVPESGDEAADLPSADRDPNSA
jgi:hypothetical protein